MKPDAFIINVARGGVVDEAALAAALEAGTIAGAAVDVYSSEPPAEDNPLLSAPNIILTPHLGASTAEAQTRVAVEAAEQVREVLAGRSARYAINAPMLTPETADALAPYLPLARTLGQFYAQFSEDLSDLTLEVAGELSEFDAGPLVASALGGILEQHTEERVNVINAGAMAKARGISLSVHHTSEAGRFSSLLTLRGERSVAGTVSFGGEARLVALDGYEVDLAPARNMLVSRHQDRPGAIGTVGRIMGEADINISNMHLGRSDKRSIAFMILALDEPVPESVAETGPRLRRHARRLAHQPRPACVTRPTTLALVRHGESAWIAEGRFQGRGDPPLSEVGIRQAAAVAARLAAPVGDAFGAVARPSAAGHLALAAAARRPDGAGHPQAREADAPLRPLDDLMELGQGEWEGLTHDEVRARWPDELAAWRDDPLDHHAPGGESLPEALARARLARDAILGLARSRLLTRAPAWHPRSRCSATNERSWVTMLRPGRSWSRTTACCGC